MYFVSHMSHFLVVNGGKAVLVLVTPVWLEVSIFLMNGLPGMSNPWPAARKQPRMALNVAQHKIANLLKT